MIDAETDLLQLTNAWANFNLAAKHLCRAASSLEEVVGFEDTTKEIKETIGDIVCAAQAIDDTKDIFKTGEKP